MNPQERTLDPTNFVLWQCVTARAFWLSCSRTAHDRRRARLLREWIRNRWGMRSGSRDRRPADPVFGYRVPIASAGIHGLQNGHSQPIFRIAA